MSISLLISHVSFGSFSLTNSSDVIDGLANWIKTIISLRTDVSFAAQMHDCILNDAVQVGGTRGLFRQVPARPLPADQVYIGAQEHGWRLPGT